MGLKAIVSNINEVPEALREYYTQVGDEYVLDADDKDYKGRINEFRTNNINLANEARSLQDKMKQYKDIDPEKWKEAQAALEKVQELEDKKLIDEGKVDELLAQRTERMQQSYEQRLDKLMTDKELLTGERDTFKNRLSQSLIDSTITAAISEAGIPRKGAIPDILARARQDWSLDEKGDLVPMRDGVLLYGDDTKNPLTPKEWSASLLQTAGHLFEPNAGGGASGGTGNSGYVPGIIPASDTRSVNNNLADIASGKITVDMDN